MKLDAAPTHEVAQAARSETWRTELLRMLAIAALSLALALLVNFIHPRPVPLWASDGPGAWPERALRISVAELGRQQAAGGMVMLLDVRSSTSYSLAHATGAISMPALNTEMFLESYRFTGPILSTAQWIVIICESSDCGTGDRVAKLLAELKHPNVRVLDGGWRAYCAAGLPTEELTK